MSHRVVNMVPNDLANAVLPTAMQIGVWQLYLLCKHVGQLNPLRFLIFDILLLLFSNNIAGTTKLSTLFIQCIDILQYK
jgi:hypothetical protein